MSYPAKTVFCFSLYMFTLSLALLLAPGLLYGLLGYTGESYVWVRLIGMFLFYLACFYLHAAWQEIRSFFYLTVYTRASIVGFMAVFVALDWLEPIFILLSLVDLAGALWTRRALAKDKPAEEGSRQS